ncbi:MAG: STAS domain-containing protein [Leptospirales bacterium]|jgi:anti-sigma B factor antagonist
MALTTRRIGKHRVVSLSGQLNFQNYADTKASLEIILQEADSASLVMDLGQVEHLDSSGIALMAHVLKSQEKKQGELQLLAVKEAVRKIMRLTHLEEYFCFIESEAELARQT